MVSALLQAAWEVIRSLPSFVFAPLFWVVIGLVAFQYSRIANTERHQLRAVFNPWFRQLPSAIWQGALGGLVASLLMVIIGVTVTPGDLTFVWILALALMLIQPRLMCFAYSGGIVSFASLLIGWPKISVPGVLGLVAVLHITESLLIYLSGDSTVTPTTIENRAGQTVAGFLLQRFWPLPLFALVAGTAPSAGGGIGMPAWWPLIPPANMAAVASMTILPVVAALGYGDVVVTTTPKEKSRQSAQHLAVYSVSLLALAILSVHYPALQLLAAIYAPVGHELVVVLNGRRETTGEPHLKPTPAGALVHAALPDSPAAVAGLKTGDVIIAVNDAPVHTAADIEAALLPDWPAVEFRLHRGDEQLVLRAPWHGEPSGVMVVPDPASPDQPSRLVIRKGGPVAAFFRKLLYRDKLEQ